MQRHRIQTPPALRWYHRNGYADLKTERNTTQRNRHGRSDIDMVDKLEVVIVGGVASARLALPRHEFVLLDKFLRLLCLKLLDRFGDGVGKDGLTRGFIRH